MFITSNHMYLKHFRYTKINFTQNNLQKGCILIFSIHYYDVITIIILYFDIYLMLKNLNDILLST